MWFAFGPVAENKRFLLDHSWVHEKGQSFSYENHLCIMNNMNTFSGFRMEIFKKRRTSKILQQAKKVVENVGLGFFTCTGLTHEILANCIDHRSVI